MRVIESITRKTRVIGKCATPADGKRLSLEPSCHLGGPMRGHCFFYAFVSLVAVSFIACSDSVEDDTQSQLA